MLSFVSYFKDLFKNPVDQVFFLSILLIILIIVLEYLQKTLDLKIT